MRRYRVQGPLLNEAETGLGNLVVLAPDAEAAVEQARREGYEQGQRCIGLMMSALMSGSGSCGN